MSNTSESRQGAARRNRALRKIRASKYLPPDIKLAVQAVLDLLCPQTGYDLAWPSAATIAQRAGGRSRCTGKWYLRVIKALGIFHCELLSPAEALSLVEAKYGYKLRVSRCTFALNLFFVNPDHPLWDNSRSLPPDVDWQMGEIAHDIKAKRNAKTASRLAINPARRPLWDSALGKA